MNAPHLPRVLAYHAPLIVRRGDKLHHCTIDRLDWCEDEELLDSLRAETGKATLGEALESAGAKFVAIIQPDDARPVYEWEQPL